ncbi:MAG: Gfo/Idh/MocA family oxidoreductase [Magnetococcales bacterium]|nr:Gfo/Idh/MocA family oxidoreductase [Magnetococcales bacterium]MBF0155969.1 Gfo/Idh/MocA family oxidoreductase [Magnetococcales bacterium]
MRESEVSCPDGPRLRAAVIGVGYLGRFHAQKYKALPGVELVAVVDTNEARAGVIAAELGVPYYSDHRDIPGSLDLVSVATPTYAHSRLAEACLADGIHVLVEKPMTVTLEEADRLIALAEGAGLVLQVGHLKRFHPAVVALRNSGLLKSPKFIDSMRFSPFKSRSLDVDVVMDLMIHDVDLILNFVGSELKEIEAVGARVVTDHVDIANARLKFVNGCVANVTASRVARDAARRIRLFQKDTFISLDFISHDIVVMQRGDGTMELDGVKVPAITKSTIAIESYDTLEAEIRSFCDSVRRRSPPLVGGRDGRKALEVVQRIRESIRQSTRVMESDLIELSPEAF